jgi:hypothetical protein
MTMIKDHQKEYAIILKFRTDIVLSKMLDIPLEVAENTVYIPEGGDWTMLDSVSQRGINNVFSYGSFGCVPKYITILWGRELWISSRNIVIVSSQSK